MNESLIIQKDENITNDTQIYEDDINEQSKANDIKNENNAINISIYSDPDE